MKKQGVNKEIQTTDSSELGLVPGKEKTVADMKVFEKLRAERGR